ncbi:DUF5108 domain-containing protein [Proteiniphilum sp. UBA1028]|uniref:DUF5108 domain-containing protein n=1 Tax=Proteiniphilum sp. UBA1028 TaxID=1947251 RepID=UPI0025D862EE|nr:DUF5108 domain-containing protein [Proteiniphilum sp. UBA1028]
MKRISKPYTHKSVINSRSYITSLMVYNFNHPKHFFKICCLTIILFYACDDPYENSTFQVYNVNPVSTYLETRSDEFSEWIEILKYADLFNAINQATEVFTVFVPGNGAVEEFYKKRGISSIKDLSKEYAINLAKYHIIHDSVGIDRFIKGGRLEEKTLSDDFLTVTFDDSSGDGGFNSVYINEEAQVSEFATPVSNGYVYVINSVLSPLIESVYDRVVENGNYSIFKGALDMTSWGDSLRIIYDEIKQPNGSLLKQKRDYTVLAVTDEIYSNNGITSVNDLVTLLEAGDNFKEPENQLNKYIAYHIMAGNYPLFNLYSFDGIDQKKLWGTKSESVLEISLEDDGIYYINFGGGGNVKASFVESFSNIYAKNGVLHQVDGYLPVWQSEIPVNVLWDFCNHPDIAAYIASKGTTGQVYQTAHASTEYRTAITTLPIFKVQILNTPGAPLSSFNNVDYFTAKASNSFANAMYKDFMILSLGYLGSIEMKTPLLIAGKYKVTLQFGYASSMDFMRKMSGGSNGGGMRFSFDGEHVTDFSPIASVPSNTLNVYQYVVYEDLELSKTGVYDFKIVISDPSASTNKSFRLMLDYLQFEPIIEEIQ